MEQINEQNIDQWLFNKTEGDLSAQDLEYLNDYLATHASAEVDQELWNKSNFRAIEIEEYPRLKTIQNVGLTTSKKAWLLFVFALVFGLIALIYYSVNNKVNQEKSKEITEPITVKTNAKTPLPEQDQNQMPLPGSLSSQISFTKPKEKKTFEANSTPLKAESSKKDDFDNASNKNKIETFVNIALKKPEVFPMPQIGRQISSFNQPNRMPSKKQKHKFQKAKRRTARTNFNRNASKGHDPLIIPLESIGF